MFAARLRGVAPSLIFAAALAAGSCARHRASAEPTLAPAPALPVMLLVYNHNWLPVRVYATRGGGLHRLGTFTTSTGELIEIPRQLYATSGVVRFVFSLVGSNEAWAPEGIFVSPGDIVVWTIDGRLHHSSVLIW